MSDRDDGKFDAPSAADAVRIFRASGLSLRAALSDIWAVRPGRGRPGRLRALADRMVTRGEDPEAVQPLRDAADR